MHALTPSVLGISPGARREPRLATAAPRWHGRPIQYTTGSWSALRDMLPRFGLAAFESPLGGIANPHLRTVVREPDGDLRPRVPVGVVSNTYALAQHVDVADRCVAAMEEAGAVCTDLRAEVGLTALGEWMNLRVYCPETFAFTPRDGHKLELRVEAFNSVDGSSRLIVLLSWFRLICSNGLAIKETLAEVRGIHNPRLDLGRISETIGKGIKRANADRRRLEQWQDRRVSHDSLRAWVDGALSTRWGRKAAARVYHICLSGHDVELADPFEPGPASAKSVGPVGPVPGAPVPAATLYDVSQALSWVATARRDAEERLAWQTQVPSLIKAFAG